MKIINVLAYDEVICFDRCVLISTDMLGDEATFLIRSEDVPDSDCFIYSCYVELCVDTDTIMRSIDNFYFSKSFDGVCVLTLRLL